MQSIQVEVLYLDMNSYFASVEQQIDPSLQGRPVGVLTVDQANACCIAASYEAKACGVKVGTRRSEAVQLCPDIQFRMAKHDLYVDYHHRILDAASQILPVEKAQSVDEFYCRLSGADRSLGRALELAQEMRQSIYNQAGQYLRCSIGLGTSVLLAKLAGELRKPDGLEWLTPQVMPNKIAHLSLRDVPGIGRRMAQRLAGAGILTIPQLYALNPKHARQIWHSVEGERFIRALQGEDISISTAPEKRSMGHGQVLSPENRTPSGARLVARRLLIKAATRLRRDQYFATYLHVSVKCRRRGRLSLGGSFPATQDSFQLLRHFRLFWTSLKPIQPGSVNVMLGGLVAQSGHIADLFEDRNAAGELTEREKLCLLVDGLNQRYGADTVFYGEKPISMARYTGAKIAFGRVPLRCEFRD
ncbi:hypothetical protein [Roseovarius sp. EL26]|uniref:Y-family DNA polymerase n=1 Tax=Roseovarius sp. EL26 TaxID=2126672 RepID=UPI0013C47D84|nr:hypothetical protein [Roseovarius sp. EL26]